MCWMRVQTAPPLLRLAGIGPVDGGHAKRRQLERQALRAPGCRKSLCLSSLLACCRFRAATARSLSHSRAPPGSRAVRRPQKYSAAPVRHRIEMPLTILKGPKFIWLTRTAPQRVSLRQPVINPAGGRAMRVRPLRGGFSEPELLNARLPARSTGS
jgi:hypothetical protein